MKIGLVGALLAGSLSASNLALAQGQSAPALATPNPQPSAAAAPSGEATAVPSASVAAPAQPTAPMKQMTVSALTDKDLERITGSEIGDIERVVESVADKKQYLVVSTGGFLGLFDTERVIPLNNVTVQGDHILLHNMTDDQLTTLPKFDNSGKVYRELDSGQTVAVSERK
ncbi:MAG: PRC-barrel domain protein [Microvirga sp.]|jgi:hypothetical protein|nr:PRC-barrel domain protein [Microvirga sp.]